MREISVAETLPPGPAPADENPFRYVHSTEFADLLSQLGVSLFVSTYQAGKLVVVRAAEGRISTLLRSFEQPMGLAVDQRRLAVGTRNQIWILRNAPDIAPQVESPGRHDACYLPRSCHVTGDIRGHEIAWGGDELWIVNTRFSCLCTLHADFSFVPHWRPPFVTALAAEDRCHLNGLAIVDGRPKFVTTLGESDTADGWRPNKARGGCVIDVASGQIVARGLSMPHSPRVHNGRLWVLDSGTASLLVLDPRTGQRETVARVPGYARGLAFHDRFAFVGLSKIRETSTFGGLPIAEKIKELQCGVSVIDWTTGQTVGFLQFQAGVEEIFDVQVLASVRFPAVVGFQKETIQGVFVIP
jgi:uncharacterized protein (TIGR03032 family)